MTKPIRLNLISIVFFSEHDCEVYFSQYLSLLPSQTDKFKIISNM